MAGKKVVAVKEKGDSRAVRQLRNPSAEKALPKSLQHKFHTVNIAEQEGELPYVDVFISGTVTEKRKVKSEKIVDGKTVVETAVVDEEVPFARNYQILRGMDVANVPAAVVHVLMETAVETRFRQEPRYTKTGDKRMAFIPYKKRSYPCTIVESYDEKKVLDEAGEEFQNPHPEDILIEE